MKLFLDANILFSGSDEGSATRRLLDRAREQAELLTSPHAWEEARRNLELTRPHLLAGLEVLRDRVRISHAFTLPEELDVVEKDKPVIAGAIGSRCTHFWTSDRRHFGALYGQTVHGVLIVSSIQLADALAALDAD